MLVNGHGQCAAASPQQLWAATMLRLRHVALLVAGSLYSSATSQQSASQHERSMAPTS
jgi:hypothetical protein